MDAGQEQGSGRQGAGVNFGRNGRILITGGAGFIGSHLTEALLNLGFRVQVVDDLSSGQMENISHLADHPGFHFLRASASSPDVIRPLIDDCHLVFHLAASVGVKQIMDHPVHCLETNFLGTRAVLQAACQRKVKVIVTSTSEIYGKSHAVPFREDDDALLGPTSRNRWAYAASKMVGEFLALAYYREKQLPVVVARLFNTVGPRQTGRYGMVIPRLIRQALLGEPLTVFGDGSQSRCFLHVKDAVAALLGLSTCPDAVGKVFNVGSTEEIKILDLAFRILSQIDQNGIKPKPHASRLDGRFDYYGATADGRIVFVPLDKAYQGGFEDMERRVPDINRIYSCIGWRPKFDLDRILRDVIDNMTAETP